MEKNDNNLDFAKIFCIFAPTFDVPLLQRDVFSGTITISIIKQFEKTMNRPMKKTVLLLIALLTLGTAQESMAQQRKTAVKKTAAKKTTKKAEK